MIKQQLYSCNNWHIKQEYLTHRNCLRAVSTEADWYYMGRSMRTHVLGICGQRRHRSACASAQSDQCLRCPLTESVDTIECINVEQMPGWYFAHALDESEAVTLAHDRWHRFACRGPHLNRIYSKFFTFWWLHNIHYMSYCALTHLLILLMYMQHPFQSLDIMLIWSVPWLSANRVSGHYIIHQCRANVRMRLCACVGCILRMLEDTFSLAAAHIWIVYSKLFTFWWLDNIYKIIHAQYRIY